MMLATIWRNMSMKDFDEINGEIFCKVYVPPVKENSNRQLSKGEKEEIKKLARFKMLIEGSFRQHYDTGQLAKKYAFVLTRG